MHCPACGSNLRDEARACLACGELIRRKVTPTDRLEAAPIGVPTWFAFEGRKPDETLYGAGRLARIFAAVVDGIILSIVVSFITFLAGPTFEANLDSREFTIHWPVFIAVTALQAAYYIAFPATRWQGTPGKKLLGLRILDLDDRPIGVLQSAMRFVFQQLWFWVGIPLAVVAVSFSPWGAIFPLLAVLAVAVAFWMLCNNGRSPWDYMAGTKVVD
jgi:uncharacterized RDD family membrane protein YckC